MTTCDCFPLSNGVPWVRTGLNGRRQVTGDTGLKDTQTYPPSFGHAVAATFNSHRSELIGRSRDMQAEELEEISLDQLMSGTDDWRDASLDPVFELLMELASR